MSYQGLESGQMKITLEPELELQVVGASPTERHAMARLYFRWSKQLFLSAELLRVPSGLPTEHRHAPGLRPQAKPPVTNR